MTSALLYIYLEAIGNWLNGKRGMAIGEIRIKCTRHADDRVLLAGRKSKSVKTIEYFHRSCEDMEMKIIKKETKCCLYSEEEVGG